MHFFLVLLLMNTLKKLVSAITNMIMNCLVLQVVTRAWNRTEKTSKEKGLLCIGESEGFLWSCFASFCKFKNQKFVKYEKWLYLRRKMLREKTHLTTERYCLHLLSSKVIKHGLNSALKISRNRFSFFLPAAFFQNWRK